MSWKKINQYWFKWGALDDRKIYVDIGSSSTYAVNVNDPQEFLVIAEILKGDVAYFDPSITTFSSLNDTGRMADAIS